MIRIVVCTVFALAIGGPLALVWWAVDDTASAPLSPIFVIWLVIFAAWPEPRRVRSRTAR